MANEIQPTHQLLNLSFDGKVSNTINGKTTSIPLDEDNGHTSFQKSVPDLKNPFGTWLNFIPSNGTNIKIDSGLKPTNELTVSFWTNEARNIESPIFSFSDSNEAFTQAIQLPSPNSPIFSWQTEKGATSKTTSISLTPNQAIGWAHWTIVKKVDQEIATISLYRNGIFLKTAPLALNVTAKEMGNNPQVLIGRNVEASKAWAGKLAHLRMWSVALTESEVAQEHNLDVMDIPYKGSPLQAYFKMDGIQNQKIPNQLGDQMMAEIENYTDGMLVTGQDQDQFDSWLQLDASKGQQLTLPSAAFIYVKKQLTLDFWVKTDTPHATFRFLELNEDDKDRVNFMFFDKTLQFYASPNHTKKSVEASSKWQHIAMVFDQNTKLATLYINGTKACDDVSFTFSVGLLNKALFSYQKEAGIMSFALIRVWNCALTPIQIGELIKADQGLTPKAATGILPSPLAFALQDKDEQPAIYITDQATGNIATLAINNRGNQDLELKAINDGKDYHIELRFRGGTLLNDGRDATGKALIQLDTANSSSNWKMKEQAVLHADGSVSFQFYCTAATTLVHGDQGKPIKLVLQNIRAAAGADGTRGTRIQLHYRNILIDKQAVEGDLLQYLNIINHQGKSHIPLHSYLANTTILNDGSDNERTVHLVNTQALNTKDAPIPFKKGNGITIPASKITIRFDQGTADWMLIDQKPKVFPTLTLQKKDIKGTVTSVFKPDATDGGKHESLTKAWVFVPEKDFQLQPQEELILTITKLATTKAAGEAYIHIDYEDIDGYWDGNFQVGVQKSPIVIHQVGTEATVSVGANTTAVKVNGTLISDQLNIGTAGVKKTDLKGIVNIGAYKDYENNERIIGPGTYFDEDGILYSNLSFIRAALQIGESEGKKPWVSMKGPHTSIFAGQINTGTINASSITISNNIAEAYPIGAIQYPPIQIIDNIDSQTLNTKAFSGGNGWYTFKGDGKPITFSRENYLDFCHKVFDMDVYKSGMKFSLRLGQDPKGATIEIGLSSVSPHLPDRVIITPNTSFSLKVK